MSDDRIAALRLADFEALVGTRIDVDFGAGPQPADVLSAQASGGYPVRPGGGFSVLLRAAVAQPRQGVFRLSHPVHGALDLFLCPRRFDTGQVVYELIFN